MLKENTYQVLIVSSREKISQQLASLVNNSILATIDFANELNLAKRMLAERDYDFVIINSPVHEENATEFSILVKDSYDIGELLLVRSEEYPEAMDKTNGLGILTLSKPLSVDLFVQSVQILCSTKKSMTEIRNRNRNGYSLKSKMEEIQLVNQAKLKLIAKKGMTEEEAHKYILKYSMDLRISKKAAAEMILRRYR